jgi:hypothetical protein
VNFLFPIIKLSIAEVTNTDLNGLSQPAWNQLPSVTWKNAVFDYDYIEQKRLGGAFFL